MANFCTNCGAEVPVGSGFCPKCGNMVTLGSADSQGTASNVGNTASQGDNAKQGGIKFGRKARTPEEVIKRKNILIGVLIAIIVYLVFAFQMSMNENEKVWSKYNSLQQEYDALYNRVSEYNDNMSGKNGLSGWFSEVFGN